MKIQDLYFRPNRLNCDCPQHQLLAADSELHTYSY